MLPNKPPWPAMPDPHGAIDTQSYAETLERVLHCSIVVRVTDLSLAQGGSESRLVTSLKICRACPWEHTVNSGVKPVLVLGTKGLVE